MSEELKFGRVQIHPTRRQVWVDGVPATLGARAFDLLMLLVEQRGRVVPKAELFAKIWPGLFVEENNLSVQIAALRRVLGSNVISTVTGRGYRFVAQASGEGEAAADAAPAGNLPVRLEPLYGREQELIQVRDAFDALSCVTLCGLAGVGKTTLATQAAVQLAAERRYAHGAWRVELGSVTDPAMLPQAVSEVVGIELDGKRDPLRECIAQLQHRELLLVLDNCEHIIDAVATLVDGLLSRARRVHVLATSQEPLRVPGERILRLNPLEVPTSSHDEDATAYGAVRMLLERVRAAMGGIFEPSAPELVEMIEICRQLDGVPLALEFAAARVPVLGLAGVRSRLYDRLRLLARGPRTAPSRHRSVQAALEWSHQLLSPQAQEVLQRLAVFPGGFSLVGAELLLGEQGTEDGENLIEHLNVLVDRSLVTLQPGTPPRYRLLETTRTFALDCLQAESESGDGIDWQARHAQALGRLCLLAARERDSTWMWQEMPNARAALAWALTAPGQGELAVTIATYISVVLAAGGAIREALDHLLDVQPLLDDDCPAPLAARYWHWLGRLGVEGRLPSSQCVEALLTADSMFAALGERRHRHACQRHLAEAELRAGRAERAEQHLAAARELEQTGVSAADRMRRLRVEAMLADARQQHEEALRHQQAALALALAQDVDRYRLLLMADMAWTHLQMGQAEAAVEDFQELLQHFDDSIRQGLARARALSGLTAALVAAGRIEEAVASVGDSVLALQQANLLRSRCEVFAWVAAAAGEVQVAAQLIGAGEAFAAQSETERDPISMLACRHAMALIETRMPEPDYRYWSAQGGSAGETELLGLLGQAFPGMQADAFDGGYA
ncbi:winged helix-turn-helix domain-containing protein [Paucibacter sp. R3-3]|uniref:Winged helix-turn-helix domain-containing protein n=1 Tax=Roseateles agri TaxID=3098619 RepID=A0ABU5DS25_9BURK|nr:winged helix-turn-helix domain-containing protein [Paucibacter sp. R3-3]MDY0749125.1 winged helix-turn-helix domain-containing protein [Paucibacter sp. R3-3]